MIKPETMKQLCPVCATGLGFPSMHNELGGAMQSQFHSLEEQGRPGIHL